MSNVIHLVAVGDGEHEPCRRCGRQITGMTPGDGFTTDAEESTCCAQCVAQRGAELAPKHDCGKPGHPRHCTADGCF